MSGPLTAELRWVADQTFEARVDRTTLVLDGESERGLSPMQHLAVGIAGCMGIDVVHILDRMRTPATALEVRIEAERADEPPRRFTRITLGFALTGEVPDANLERALALSRDRYCSAWASVRQDVELVLRSSISPPPPPA